MFEQDYIMREIRTTIRAVMKAFFGTELAENPIEPLERLGRLMDDGTMPEEIISLARNGRYREAEQALSERISPDQYGVLRLGLAFYDFMAQLEPEELKSHGYDPDQLADGLHRLLTAYGLEPMSGLLLQ